MSQPPEFRGSTHRSLTELRAWTKQREEPALEPDLPIIDPHHHVWDDDRGRYLIDELVDDLSTGHNIVATVYAQFKAMYRAEGPPSMQPGRRSRIRQRHRRRERQWPLRQGSACAKASSDMPIFCWATMCSRCSKRSSLQATAASAAFAMARRGTAAAQDMAGHSRRRTSCSMAKFRRGFARLAPLGLSFDAWLFYPQLPDLIDLLQAFPDTEVILDHAGGILGIPPHTQRDEVFSIWRSHIRRARALSQFECQDRWTRYALLRLGFPCTRHPAIFSRTVFRVAALCRDVHRSLRSERCMFESNFPVDKQSCGYGVLWNAFKRITQNCSTAEKAALYHDTAARVYRLPR